jgi:hypothetical protein
LDGGDGSTLINAGVLFERINYSPRYFLPAGKQAENVLQNLINLNKNIIRLHPPSEGEAEVESQSGTIQRTAAAPATHESSAPVPFVMALPKAHKAQRLHGAIEKDKTGNRVGLRSILEYLASVLHTEIRIGREQTSKRNPAHYNTDANLIRDRSGANAAWGTHELGHSLSNYMRHSHPLYMRGITKELVDLTQSADSFASAIWAALL